MFGWFRTRCPLETHEKVWADRRMSWLARAFGVRRLREAAVVLPTEEFFPDPYGGTEADALRMYRRVGRFLGIDPGRARLEFFDEGEDGFADEVCVYVPGSPERILVNRELLADPVALVAAFGHGIGNLLLAGGRVAEDEPDREALADLLTVILGLGVFGANAVIRESYAQDVLWYSWRITARGQLSEREYGYALALFAWIREEARPAWADYLRPNVRGVFRQALTYLLKTGDTLFREAEEEGGDVGRRVAGRVEALADPSAPARLAALWDLEELGEQAAPAMPALTRALRDPDPSVQAGAASALAALGSAAGPAVEDLIEATVREGNPGLHLEAASALGRIGRGTEPVVSALRYLLNSPVAWVRAQAAESLGALGPAAGPAVEHLVEQLGDVDGSAAIQASLALGEIGGMGLRTIPALLRALERGEGDLPVAAAHALGRIGPVTDEVIPALRKALHHPNPDVGEEAARSLGTMGVEVGAADRPSRSPRPKRGKRRRTGIMLPPEQEPEA